MKISKECPELYKILKERFNVDWDKGICIVIGDICHSKNDLLPDLFEHELTHSNQQKVVGIEMWWRLYIENDDFRLRQEVEAYRNQIKWMKKHTEVMSRDIRRQRIDSCAKQLSGPMYGNIVTYKKAKELLQ